MEPEATVEAIARLSDLGLERSQAAQVVERALALEESAIGLAVAGSYAKRTATSDSDLDVVLFTGTPPVARYMTWFESRLSGRPLHVSLGVREPHEWLKRAAQPEAWSLGLPARFDAVWLWATGELRATLGDDPTQHHPAADAELEDLVETLIKARRALRIGDAFAARLHARDAAELMPRLLHLLEPGREVADRADAIYAALELPTVPHGFRADFSVALGLDTAETDVVVAAAFRLGRGTLTLVRERAPHLDPQPGIATALQSGVLERLLDD